MLRRTLPADQWHVREEKHVEIADDWKPRPDVHVLRGSFEDYWRGNRRPGRHDVVLLVEVCETTHQHDEVFKARGYALARSPLYWLVDLRARRIRVYSKPRARRYTSIVDFAEGEMLPITIGGLAWPSVPVADLLPPRRSG